IFVGENNDGGMLGWSSGTRDTLRNTGAPIDAAAGKRANSPPVAAGTNLNLLFVGGFGSYHAEGANFAFGDGSVRIIRLNIEMSIYRRLGNRADGELPADF